MKIKHIEKAPQGFADYEDKGIQLIDGVYLRHYEATPWSVAKVKETLKERVTARRWEVETGGIALPDGTHIKTGKDDQARISNAANAAKSAPEGTQINFKKGDGTWVVMSTEALISLGLMVFNHVQDCFSKEMQHHIAIDNLQTYEELVAYDINSLW